MLIAERQFDKLHDEFKQWAIQKGGYFMLKHPTYDSYDESIFFVDIEQDDNMISTGYTFAHFIDKRIEEELNKTILSINEESQLLDDNEISAYYSSLINHLNTLEYLNNNSDVLQKQAQLNNALSKISGYIESCSISTSEGNSEDLHFGETIFGYKGKSNSNLRFLYNTLAELGFFDPYHDQYDIFYKIITTPTSTIVVNLHPLKISCDNYTAAYILRKLEPLFSRLNYRNISKANIIHNRKNKPFTESGLSKALNHFMRKSETDETLKNDIDTVLNSLIK